MYELSYKPPPERMRCRKSPTKTVGELPLRKADFPDTLILPRESASCVRQGTLFAGRRPSDERGSSHSRGTAMNRAFVVLLTGLLAGCSGMVIQPLTAEQAKHFHSNDVANRGQSGYVVYAPKVYFAVGLDDKQNCTVGKPFVLPDYDRPYRLDSKPGLGKAGTEFTIADGWALGTFKDNSDNTALLTALVGGNGILLGKNGQREAKCPVGLYRVSDSSLELVSLPTH